MLSRVYTMCLDFGLNSLGGMFCSSGSQFELSTTTDNAINRRSLTLISKYNVIYNYFTIKQKLVYKISLFYYEKF